jgi:DNA primase
VSGEIDSLIKETTIAEIKQKANLVAVISDYVKLKQRGKNFVGLCPFHSEKTGSFTVSPEKGLFHCFGCHAGGNLFSFIMKIENVDFTGACEILANKLGIKIVYDRAKAQRSSEKDRCIKINALALAFFKEKLASPAGDGARDYLSKRKISPRAAELFELGFAPDAWDELYKHLISRGVDPVHAAAAGLTIKKDTGEGYFDRFRNRIIFPIRNLNGDLCGFGGRTITNQEPKYLNSPDTPAYNKSDILYGLNLAKNQVKSAHTLVLVEGYMDLISTFSAGVEFAAATLGTALTTQHAKLIQRFADNVVLCFDSDLAGSEATRRSIEILRNLDIAVQVCDFSPHKDPDEFITKEGSAAFSARIKAALPHLQYSLETIKARHGIHNIEAKAKAAQEAAMLLARENNQILQSEYAKVAAALLEVDLNTLKAEIKKAGYYKSSSSQNAPSALNRQITLRPKPKIEAAEKMILGQLLQDDSQRQELIGQITAEVGEKPFFSDGTAEIFDAILRDAESLPATSQSTTSQPIPLINPAAEANSFIGRIFENIKSEAARALLSELAVQDLGETDAKEKMLQDCLNVLKSYRLKAQADLLKLQISEAETRGEFSLTNELHKKFADISQKMRQIQSGDQ